MTPLAIAAIFLLQVPPAVSAKELAATKQAAYLAQTASAALNHDLGLLQRLDTPFPSATSFRETTAGELMKIIRATTKSAIEIDTRVVGDSGGWELKTVSCDPTTVRQALDALVRAISPEYERFVVDVAAGMLVITDAAGQRTLKCQAQYPLAQMLPRLGAQDGAQDGGHDEMGSTIELARTELENFIMLTQHDDWFAMGGDIARIDWTGSVATVEATPAMHFEIRKRLAQLEESLPSLNLQWAVRVVEFTAATKPNEIDAAVASQQALDALFTSGGAKVLAASTILTPAGEVAQARIVEDNLESVMRIEPISTKSGRSFVVRTTVKPAGAIDAAAATSEISLRAIPGVRAAATLQIGGRRLLVDCIGLSEGARKLMQREK